MGLWWFVLLVGLCGSGGVVWHLLGLFGWVVWHLLGFVGVFNKYRVLVGGGLAQFLVVC